MRTIHMPKANQKNRPFGLLWFVVSFGLWFEKITPASGNV